MSVTTPLARRIVNRIRTATGSPGARDDVTDLVADLLADWQPGAPQRVCPETIAADEEACAELNCPVCRHEFMQVNPEHLGRRYRIRCECPRCGCQLFA